MGTQEGPALNLNKDDEGKRCRVIGHQQDTALQRYVTFSVFRSFSLKQYIVTLTFLLLSLSRPKYLRLTPSSAREPHKKLLSFPVFSLTHLSDES